MEAMVATENRFERAVITTNVCQAVYVLQVMTEEFLPNLPRQ
jgi:hypothetical protein